MGHIRLGRLPRTKRWKEVFTALEQNGANPALLAHAVAQAGQNELIELKNDKGINYYFWLLTNLANAGKSDDISHYLNERGLDISKAQSTPHLIQLIARFADAEAQKRSRNNLFLNLTSLAFKNTITDAILRTSQSLFGASIDNFHDACKHISTKKHFEQLSKNFFADITRRILSYVIDKELSNNISRNAQLSSPADAIELHNNLQKHCRETARIIEEFSGGWFSKHNWKTNRNISEQEAQDFTSYAIEKIQLELRRAQNE